MIKFPHLPGQLFLGLGIPLLLWQATPAHQFVFPPGTYAIAHTVMETFAVIVSSLIFFTAYGEHDTQRSPRTILLGYAALAAGLFDMLHLLSNVGMPDFFSPNSPHKSIVFWLYGRAAIAIGLLLYVLLPDKGSLNHHQRNFGVIITIATVVLLGSFSLIHLNELPLTFIQGQGLTPLKIVLEWSYFAIYLGSAVVLYLRRHVVTNCDFRSLLLALLLLAVGELFFTVYVSAGDSANTLGHIYKVVAYYYLYRSIYAEAIRLPFDKIKHMLVHDDLTGLPNRKGFTEKLAQEIQRAKSNGASLAVLLINLDHFQNINAVFGHESGDLLLINVAKRISDTLPASMVARFGGDEFAVLLTPADVGQAEQLGRAVQQNLALGFALVNDHIEIGASLGIALYPVDGESASLLLRHADLALHHAKWAGRNALAVFSSDLSHSIQRRVQLENGLKQALQRKEFKLLYQPKVGLHHGQIVGAEALLRWESSELGNISPMEFIPVAEEIGLILPIGDWVLAQTCAQLQQWREQGIAVTSVAINLSTRQFRQKDLVTKIKTTLQRYELPPRLLELEITESAIMDNIDAAAEMLAELSRSGIHIAIDDFGTGYSSLGYLKSFAIHSLKIDRSFIRDIPGDKDDETIVRMIIALGASMDLQIVAEGVETAEQVKYLHASQCDQIQGYYFSRPVTAEAFADLLRSEQQLVLPA